MTYLAVIPQQYPTLSIRRVGVNDGPPIGPEGVDVAWVTSRNKVHGLLLESDTLNQLMAGVRWQLFRYFP
ncbi:hypothetical protein TPA0908_49430 [Micromonospora sp. AKA38]|nr:hypothetical protein TPA0908_49430 [Micromonospora sp. AKA38]